MKLTTTLPLLLMFGVGMATIAVDMLVLRRVRRVLTRIEAIAEEASHEPSQQA